MKTIERIVAEVHLDDPDNAVADAGQQAASGDEDWRRWLEEYERGEALIVHLDVFLEFEAGGPQRLRVHNRGVWVEKDSHPPRLEAQIAEIVSKDFDMLSDQLAAHGIDCSDRQLAEMFVHIELDEAVREALHDQGAERQADRPGIPDIEISASKAHD